MSRTTRRPAWPPAGAVMRRCCKAAGVLILVGGLALAGPGRAQPRAPQPGAVEDARAQCRTLIGDGVEVAPTYSGTHRRDIYWRFRDGYRVAGEREASVVLRLERVTWSGGGGQGVTLAFREANGRWRAAHLPYGTNLPTRYNVWTVGTLAPALGAELDALIADPCLATEPGSILQNIKGPGGTVLGKCGDAVGSVTHHLEVSVGPRTQRFTRQCGYGLAGAIAERLHPPRFAGAVTEERF